MLGMKRDQEIADCRGHKEIAINDRAHYED